MFTTRRRVSLPRVSNNLRQFHNHCAKAPLGVVYPRTPQDEPEEMAFDDLPAKTPREAFQSLIDKFRELRYISHPSNSREGEYQLVVDGWDVVVPDNAPERVRKLTEELYSQWQHSRGLRDIYLQCGWRPEQIEQSAFRRDEFIERRRRYLFD